MFRVSILTDWSTGSWRRNDTPRKQLFNGHCESFNGKLRDELLNGEIFYTLKEAEVIIEHWRNHYNTKRPHSALSYRPPAPEVVLPREITDELEKGQKVAWTNSTTGPVNAGRSTKRRSFLAADDET